MSDSIYVGASKVVLEKKEVKGYYTELDAEHYFIIENYDQMRPFFMTVVSSSDHWLFISSNGGLSAGRRNPENAIFPYYTDDKINDSKENTGNKTLLRVKDGEKTYLWEPFLECSPPLYNFRRNIYKNREGSRIIFEEVNLDLGLRFRYGWMFSDKYGIIKRSWLENIDEKGKKKKVEILDGVRNILPHGVDSKLQAERSTLVDAYKRCELDKESMIGIYSLSAMIVDKAEPSESLLANSVWTRGLEIKEILLSSLQLNDFIQYGKVETEEDIKGERGAYFVRSEMEIAPSEIKEWFMACELEQSVSDIESLRSELLKKKDEICKDLAKEISEDKARLRKKIGLTDGIQLSQDRLSSGRHFSNVLFNIMRGGNFEDQYLVETSDFIDHIKTMNRHAFKSYQTILNALPEEISYHQLRYFLAAAKDRDIMRYYYEYLPLTFSRRHGDPSRPWNHFSIDIKDENGKKVRNFEGNWRDIFQNWEALLFSYPEFCMGFISKFVNASTIDGYNPYRISREGIDWEIIEEDDPWSYIGYWGDHQVIYLTKFLEFGLNYFPKRIKELLKLDIFTYANVPYRIKGYDAIISDPKETIDYDAQIESRIKRRVERVGSEGKMVFNKQGELEKANLTEKLLVMMLTKLYNLIPEGGIWMNTQRPEWNDANNALVGNGISMVTLNYLRRLLDFFPSLFHELEKQEVQINKPVVDLLEALRRGFLQFEDKLEKGFSDQDRRAFMDSFGIAGEHYRTTAYAGFTGDKRALKVKDLLSFCELAKKFLEQSISVNKREDKLYHSYNLLDVSDNECKIIPLYEMLEGQVAALSSFYLKEEEVLELCNALKESQMFRPDQYSYMLYPDRDLDGFLEKNSIESRFIKSSKLAKELLEHGNKTIIEKDIKGNYHFNGRLHNVNDLVKALRKIEDPELSELAESELNHWKACYESVFNHKAFTGRSGTFFGYEGLGSIYWHMVSKLLLALQENIIIGFEQGWKDWVLDRLIEHYYEIRAGIGVNKSPDLYGAFPTDAYSHTPKNSGAKQPGMTGQVKEDIINRWAELGISVKKGRLSFAPHILRKEEFLKEKRGLSYYNLEGERKVLEVEKGGMAFTYCQIPIEYRLGKKASMIISYSDGTVHKSDSLQLEELDSKDIFKRSGNITYIQVTITEDQII